MCITDKFVEGKKSFFFKLLVFNQIKTSKKLANNQVSIRQLKCTFISLHVTRIYEEIFLTFIELKFIIIIKKAFIKCSIESIENRIKCFKLYKKSVVLTKSRSKNISMKLNNKNSVYIDDNFFLFFFSFQFPSFTRNKNI